MAEKETYPTIPARQWWGLRNKFKQSIPTSVTPGYLAAALVGMNKESARTNVIPALKALKIINPEGKILERAKKWRDDEQYPLVCGEILKEIYPTELMEALPPPLPNRDAVERWISNKTGAGESAAGKMASLYLLLCEADPKSGQDLPPATPTKQKPQQNKPKLASAPKPPAKTEKTSAISNPPPSLHIDIQIHISPETPPEQIDHIFASMAKHLNGFWKIGND
jgi:hypothetical protein